MECTLGCVLSDLAMFFLKNFLTFFQAFVTFKRLGFGLGLEKGLGIGLSYKNTTLTIVTVLPAIL